MQEKIIFGGLQIEFQSSMATQCSSAAQESVLYRGFLSVPEVIAVSRPAKEDRDKCAHKLFVILFLQQGSVLTEVNRYFFWIFKSACVQG